MTMQQANQFLLESLGHLYDDREAKNIAALVMEKLTGWSAMDRAINKTMILSEIQESTIREYQEQLKRARPVQYVLNESWFYGMSLFVDEHVLIPRPETEELAAWALKYISKNAAVKTVLDIGTGSGCLALAIKKTYPHLEVHAVDVSEGALRVAKKNAVDQKLEIQLHQSDFLDEKSWTNLPVTDLIISNPPYVPKRDKSEMHANVLEFEPHLALFVEDEDPLIFYSNIASFAGRKVKSPGAVFLEIHEKYGMGVQELFAKDFSNVEIRHDMQQRHRMVCASK